MMVLGLDVGAWSRFEPGILADLQQVCSSCRSPQRCVDDLAKHSDDPAWLSWRDYCPNAASLDALAASNSIDWATELTKR